MTTNLGSFEFNDYVRQQWHRRSNNDRGCDAAAAAGRSGAVVKTLRTQTYIREGSRRHLTDVTIERKQGICIIHKYWLTQGLRVEKQGTHRNADTNYYAC